MKRLLFAVYILIVLSAASFRYVRPEYNWDMLPYMATVLGYDNADVDSVHSQTYDLARRYLPPAKFAALIDSTNTFRGRAYRNTNIFHDQLPFYSIKPLYVHFVRLCHLLGLPLTQATVIPSLMSFVLICTLMYVWIHKLIPEPHAFIISVGVIALPFLLEGAGSSTPDLLCAGLLLLGSYTLLEKGSLLPALVFFTGAILTRVDSILFAVILTAYSAVHHHKHRTLALAWAALMTLGVVLLYRSAGLNFPEVFLVRSASERIGEAGAQSWLGAYAKGILHGLASLMHSSIALFLIIAAGTFYVGSVRQKNEGHNSTALLLLLILFHILLRFVLHPIVEDRFLVADYLLILIILVMTLHENHEHHRRMA
jgi:hypothetical protein